LLFNVTAVQTAIRFYPRVVLLFGLAMLQFQQSFHDGLYNCDFFFDLGLRDVRFLKQVCAGKPAD
jgi:hypothetical protein